MEVIKMNYGSDQNELWKLSEWLMLVIRRINGSNHIITDVIGRINGSYKKL